MGICLLQIVPLHFRPSFTRDSVAEWSTLRTRVRVPRSDHWADFSLSRLGFNSSAVHAKGLRNQLTTFFLLGFLTLSCYSFEEKKMTTFFKPKVWNHETQNGVYDNARKLLQHNKETRKCVTINSTLCFTISSWRWQLTCLSIKVLAFFCLFVFFIFWLTYN